ncbi:LRR receptor-like serine threonine-protein kinase [Seminavis robusta]|uniref:LRR receptor-like serine threonine-protein kinase n=1 Tax=Seminavis robusta TaxID=568900 RepID=A0A9N8HJN9_9STRA|nr:LRR receptor-like serine threonine-protein kinase [Seminavis robusta]|eukprot:Sro701_g189750.1 LRR receptor-like serine threonine-protein kinase (786) ;mRNA; r:6517-9110
MSSAHSHLPNSQEEAALDSDLSLNQLVLERSQTATKTAEDIKQEELLRRAAEKRNNNSNIGAVPAHAVARRPVANTRKKAPATVTNKAVGTNASEADDQRKKDELALLRVVAERSAAASREQAELAEGASKSNNTVVVGAQAFNPGDYVSEKGDTVNLMTIVAQRSVDDDATPSMAPTENNMAPPDAGGDAVTPSPASNPAAGIEYDHQTGRPMTKHSLPPGSVTPGAYSGSPGANYQAVEPVRLDVLGASSPPRQEVPGQIEEAELNTTETLEEKKRNPVVMGAAIAVLVVVIILAIAIPLAVGGENGEFPKMENNQETSIDKVLLPNAPSSTWESIVDDQESPQFKAYTWLTLDPNLQTYENWQKEQRFALATFYYAFNGMKWNILQTQRKWLDYEINECDWGVYSGSLYMYNHLSCNNNGRATRISGKKQSNFQGAIPPELSLLETLKELNFRDSQLSGMIPSEVGLLLSLTAIDLGFNQLVGEVPSEVGQLTALTSLNLGVNQLVGEIPSEVGQLRALTSLNLGVNQLVGEVPSEVGQLTALTSLNLGDSNLVGEVPSEVGQLTALRSLDLQKQQLSGSLPTEIGMLSSVKTMQLRGNQLSGTLPSELGLLTVLLSLDLFGNQLSGVIPSEIGLLSALTLLNLASNKFQANFPTELGLLTDSADLWADLFLQEGTIPTEIGVMTGRTSLHWLFPSVSGGSIPSEIGLMTSLTAIEFRRKDLSGSLPSEMGLLTSVTKLRLDGNGFSGSIPTELGLLTNVTSLVLWKFPEQLVFQRGFRSLP